MIIEDRTAQLPGLYDEGDDLLYRSTSGRWYRVEEDPLTCEPFGLEEIPEPTNPRAVQAPDGPGMTDDDRARELTYREQVRALCAAAEAINGDTPRGDIWAIVGTRPRARALA